MRVHGAEQTQSSDTKQDLMYNFFRATQAARNRYIMQRMESTSDRLKRIREEKGIGIGVEKERTHIFLHFLGGRLNG